jgi:SseB protein N-terminal domain/SseB protein C-terminal domain
MSVFDRLARLFGGGTKAQNPGMVDASDTGEAHAKATQSNEPAFEPRNALEQQLMLAGNDAAERPKFIAMLLESDLYVATPEPPDHAEHRVVEAGETLSILNIHFDNGKSLPAFFTAEERIAPCFGDGLGFVAMNGRTLLEMAGASGAWLNPSSSYGVHWTADDIAAMLGRPVQWQVEEETQVLLGTPAAPPEAMINELRGLLAKDSRVEAAWLALAHWVKSDEWAWHLDIHSAHTSADILPGIQSALRSENLMGKAVNVVVNPPGSAAGQGIPVILRVLQ